MSASAAAHEGSRSTKALTATRSCTTTWRLMRSTRWQAVASSRPGWRRQVVRATFTMRSALRSSSWAIFSAIADEAQVGPAQTRLAHDAEALVLDRVAQRVDGVVVGDHPVRVVEIAVDEGLGARTDGIERERREPHDVEPHVVDALADPRIRVFGHHLRGDHVTIMDAVAATSPRRSVHCFPAVHLPATMQLRRVHGLSVRSARLIHAEGFTDQGRNFR